MRTRRFTWFHALQRGYPFFSAALSFLPVQVCACLQSFLYFRRFPSAAEKLKFVPGLEAKRPFLITHYNAIKKWIVFVA
ncbi:hypothetical protein Y032_0364g3566 [Ancylostoma ceylanicum]|uniref:Uncharacterized protein n=1 Tax=Ancylostoma ceylanicum TaxID=53326 RepID=A0A016RVA2_9BILA|nr:hypothetical protein Y032_0364g3566 [Ancylostoma ceylanicum]